MPAGESTEARARAGRVLVVDDELALARVAARLLQRDHEVDTACSGAEALEKVRTGPGYDVILCDVSMPQMTGIELHDVLARERPEWGPRFIFMTGGVVSPAAREKLAGLPNVRIDKPLDVARLRDLVAARIAAATGER